jgi:hypothetical protein
LPAECTRVHEGHEKGERHERGSCISPNENLCHDANLRLPKFHRLRKMKGRAMIPRPKTL